MTIIDLSLSKDEFIESQWQELFSCGIKKLPDNNRPYVQFKNLLGEDIVAVNEKFIIFTKEDKVDSINNNLKKMIIIALFGSIKSGLLRKGHNCISIRRSIEHISFIDPETNALVIKVSLRMLSCKDADEEDFKANCLYSVDNIRELQNVL